MRVQCVQRILIITLYIVLQVCALVEGLYQLEVTVFGYNNPTGRCQGCGDDRGCCDEFGSTSCAGDDLCDSFFNYCLRTLGSTGRGCSYFGNQRSDSTTDDGALDFSQDMVLGLENPITLQGLTDTYMGVQLHIELTDEDSGSGNPNDLIDVLLIDHDLPIGQPSPRQNYTGIYDINFVTMDLSIVATCVGNFQGPDCSQCLPGFTGIMCEINIDDCIGVNCSGNGQCVDGVLSYTCDCDPGFTEAECDVNIDECVAVNCGNGQCVDGVHAYTCECDPGFTGVECGININNCVGENCSGNGQCVDGIDSFSCNCNDSFTGPLCEIRASDVDSEAERFSATFIGGILGAILSFALLLALLIILVISIVMHKKHKVCYQAKKERIKTVHHEVPTVSVRYTKPPSHNTEEDVTRKFDNPIYGTDENDKVKGRAREVERVDQSRLLSMSLPDHEFDNPIYATEEPENAYSMVTDVSAQDSETNRQLQATYESIDDGQLPSSYRPLVNGAFGH